MKILSVGLSFEMKREGRAQKAMLESIQEIR